MSTKKNSTAARSVVYSVTMSMVRVEDGRLELPAIQTSGDPTLEQLVELLRHGLLHVTAILDGETKKGVSDVH